MTESRESHLGEHAPLMNPTVQWTLFTMCLAAFLAIFLHVFVHRHATLPPKNNYNSIKPASLQLDLNDADRLELSLLPGVGTTLAARICAEREAHGAFLSIADLRRVTGIGPKKIAEISKYCVVQSPDSLSPSQNADNERAIAFTEETIRSRDAGVGTSR